MTNKRNKRRMAATAAVAILAALSPGCVTNADGNRLANDNRLTAAQVAERFGYTGSGGETPVLELVPGFKSASLVYAMDLLSRECSTDEYTWTVDPPESLLIDPRTLEQKDSVELAAKYGMIFPSSYSAANGGRPATDEAKAKFDACGKKLAGGHRAPQTPFLNRLYNESGEAVVKAPSLKAMAKRFNDCMKPSGFSGSSSDYRRAGGDYRSLLEERPSPDVPTAREKEVAVMAVRCREQVDWAETLRKARAEWELAEIGKHIGQFEAEKKASDEFEKVLQEAIAKYGP